MWHYVTMTLVAAAFFALAACDDFSGGLRDNTNTVSADSGKVDNPYPPDTNTADTATPEVLPRREFICPTLVPLEGKWLNLNQSFDESIVVSVSAQLNGMCLLTVDMTHSSKKTTMVFEGNELPLSFDEPDLSAGGANITRTLFLEDSLLKIKVDTTDAGSWTLCYVRLI